MNQNHVKLIKQIADLLANETATHPDFFEALANELANRGFDLEAHQGGISGTHLVLVMRPKA